MARAHWHSKDWGGARLGAGRPRPASRTRRLTITLPEALVQAIDQQAYRRQMTRSAVIADYLARGLNP